MRMHLLSLMTIVLFGISAPGVRAAEADTSLARRIAEHADTLMRGSSNISTFSMTITRPDWERSMTVKSWERGKDLMFTEVIEPPREAGTAYLKREGQMWSWLPDIERTIKIPPSMMMDSWMGSDFTNDDLMNETSLVDDYDCTLLGEEQVRDSLAWKVELVPHEDAPVVWGRIVVFVRKSDYMSLRYEYYDEDDELVRTFYFEDVKVMDGRKLPARWIMVPEDEEGHKTLLEILEIDFDVDIPDRIFTRQHLERSR